MMFNFFTLFPLLFFLVLSYYFNQDKLHTRKQKVIIVSILEGVISYLITFILFLHGFISVFGYLGLMIVLIIVLGIVLIVIQRNLDEYSDWDLQLETIKNNLVLFAITILPLYVFLTIFRYMDAYLQISFALMVSISIFGLSIIIRKWLGPLFSKLGSYVLELRRSKYVLLFVLIFITITLVTLFELPTYKTGKRLNLSNNIGYLNFDGIPKTLNNHFQGKTVIEIDYADGIDSRVTDYAYDQTHLYVYTSSGQLIVFDLSTKEVVSNTKLEYNKDDNTDDDIDVYNKFTLYNDQLIFLGSMGTYLVTPENTNKISDMTKHLTSKYYHDQKLYYVNRKSFDIYEIYQFTEGKLILRDTIDLTNSSYDQLLVISEQLFYRKDNQYIPYDDPSIAFDKLKGNPIYDEHRQIMYFTELFEKELNYYDTIYRKVDASGNKSTITLPKTHNTRGIIIDDFIYFTDDRDAELDRIEIMNSEFEFEAIYNQHQLEPLLVSDQFAKSYIANYSERGHQLEFLQIDENKHHVVLTITQIQHQEVDLELPFYTHYGLGIFIPIIIALCIPLTNYRDSISVISFESVTNKKK